MNNHGQVALSGKIVLVDKDTRIIVVSEFTSYEQTSLGNYGWQLVTEAGLSDAGLAIRDKKVIKTGPGNIKTVH